jgi:hypothetical protein
MLCKGQTDEPLQCWVILGFYSLHPYNSKWLSLISFTWEEISEQPVGIVPYPAGLAPPLSQRTAISHSHWVYAKRPISLQQRSVSETLANIIKFSDNVSLALSHTLSPSFLSPFPFFVCAGYHSAAVHKEESALICQSEQPFRRASLRGASASEWELLISPGRLA